MGASGGTFQLSHSLGGGAIPITDGRGVGHVFRVEGKDLTGTGSGQDNRLILDISAGSGQQKLSGIGGPSGAASSTDGVISASAAGGGGGAINVSTAESDASTTLTISTTIGDGATIAGGTVNVTTNGYAFSKGVAGNAGGGAISVGDSSARSKTTVTNTLTVAANATLTSAGDLTVRALSDLRPSVYASTEQGGLIGGSFGDTTARASYTTMTTTAGTLSAAATSAVEARTLVDVFAESLADVGGLGASAETEANAFVGEGADVADTLVELTGGSVTGRHVRVAAQVDSLEAYAHTYTYAIALGADSDADSEINVDGIAQTLLGAAAVIDAQVDAAILAQWLGINLEANAFAECDCAGGGTDSYARIHPSMNAKVIGRNGAKITTSDLAVAANQQVSQIRRDADTDEGFLDFGNGGDAVGDQSQMKREIFWEVRVIMLGEPNPELVVDATGMVTKIVNVRVCDSNGTCYQDDPFTNTHTQGQLGGHTFTVDDIVYDHGAKARFLANDLSGVSGPAGVVWGRGGVFEFQQTWDFVKLLNASSLNMVTNVIDVVNTNNPPVIEIRVDTIPPGTGVNTPSLDENAPAPSFDFDIRYKFPPTLVQIRNTCASICPVRQPFVRLDDYIENPLGKTELFNASGDILSGAGKEIIRTNELDADAPHGNIGEQSPTHAEPDLVRNPIMVELVRFKHPDPAFCPASAPCLYDFKLTADAGKDVVLDITANRRTDEALGSALTVTIERINAGDDVDVVVNDSKNGNDLATLVLATVNLYNPATAFYGYVYYDSYNPPLGADSGPLDVCPGNACGNGSGQYETHFRPDGTDPNLNHILRALGTVGAEIDSTYDFQAVRAGDDIDICHVSTGGQEPKTCATTAVNDATHVVTDDSAPDTTVHITAKTDVDWAGGNPEPALDDPGIGVDLPQTFIRTNGDIVETELIGDLLAGHIHSTANDVTLFSPQRILDANRQPTIDVTGVNITMTSGTLGGLGGIGQPDVSLGLGGYVEIDVDTTGAGTGVLVADDLASDDAQTLGIYLDELFGDLRVGVVQTAGDDALTTGNVSLRTVAGSILDAVADAGAADVLGQAIDIDANGGSIGTQLERPRDRLAALHAVRVRQGELRRHRRRLLRSGPGRRRRRRRARGERPHLPDRDRRLPAARPRARRDRRHPHHRARERRDRRGPVPGRGRHSPASPRATRARRAATTSTRRAACRRARSSPRPARRRCASATTSRPTRTARSWPTWASSSSATTATPTCTSART